MAKRTQTERHGGGAQDLHDVNYLRARAHHLREAAATSRDPAIAEALREVAGDFDEEAQREAALEPRPSGGHGM